MLLHTLLHLLTWSHSYLCTPNFHFVHDNACNAGHMLCRLTLTTGIMLTFLLWSVDLCYFELGAFPTQVWWLSCGPDSTVCVMSSSLSTKPSGWDSSSPSFWLICLFCANQISLIIRTKSLVVSAFLTQACNSLLALLKSNPMFCLCALKQQQWLQVTVPDKQNQSATK